jgi:hypothetical protein
MTTDVFETERASYESKNAEVLATVEGRLALIHGDEVAGTYDSQIDALSVGYKKYGVAPSFVKQIQLVEVPASPLNCLSIRWVSI